MNPAGIKPSLWRAMLRDPVDSLRALRIHDAARSCTPLGDEYWIKGLEAMLGRRVRPRPRGRPRRTGPATPA
jgi:hypothetical protein